MARDDSLWAARWRIEEAFAISSLETPGASEGPAAAASRPSTAGARVAASRRPRAATVATSPPAAGRSQTPVWSPGARCMGDGMIAPAGGGVDEVADLAVARADDDQAGAGADDRVLDAQGSDVVAGLEVVGDDDDGLGGRRGSRGRLAGAPYRRRRGGRLRPRTRPGRRWNRRSRCRSRSAPASGPCRPLRSSPRGRQDADGLRRRAP